MGRVGIDVKNIVSLDKLGDKYRLFGHVTIEPGGVLDYHEHHGEAEIYYVIAGEAEYQDNDKTYMIKTGDVTYCASGSGHGVKNLSDEPMEFIALIILE